MSDLQPDQLDKRIDSSLGRLPQWQPPADFASRLAAAAARQSLQPVVPAALVQAGNLLQQLSDAALMVTAAFFVAGLMAWVVPWTTVMQFPNLVSWAGGIALGITGLWLTRRTLTQVY
ncbi:MAG: hypothetical protein ABI616_06620 [Pseudomonadota bacterium]